MTPKSINLSENYLNFDFEFVVILKNILVKYQGMDCD